MPPPFIPSINWTAVHEVCEVKQYVGNCIHEQHQHKMQEVQVAIATSSFKLSLAECLSAAPMYEPIAHKPVSIDILKYSPTDLIGIFTPKLDAAIKRLKAVKEVDLFHFVNSDYVHGVCQLLERLWQICVELSCLASTTTFKEWH